MLAGNGLVILNQPVLKLLVKEIKLKNDIPKDAIELRFVVVWVIPVHV